MWKIDKIVLLICALIIPMIAMSASLAIGGCATPIASSSALSIDQMPAASLWNQTNKTLADVPYLVTDLLFNGNVAYLVASKLILTTICVAIAVVPLAIIRASHMAIAALGISVLIFCVVIGWCDIWVLLFIAMVIAAMWGRRISDWIYGGRED